MMHGMNQPIVAWFQLLWCAGLLLLPSSLTLPGFLLLGAVDATAPSIQKLAAASYTKKVLNVHIVPHTHDDVGWRKTVEQYYYGLNTTIDLRGSVDDILSTTILALTEHPARTFTYAETKFFSMWWHSQTTSLQDTVRYLISNKQLTFVNGGWCMHDEATTHYMGMLDQTTTGHQFLKETLGVVPTTAWQLDPFGHSATQASLLTSLAGMEALYFGRIDYQDLALRTEAAECEGLWNASFGSSSIDTTIFWGLTGSYGGNYGPPAGFCFDALCDDEPLVGANTTRLKERILSFLEAVLVQSNQTRGNHIMMTFGTDFTFKEAHIDYSNIDILIAAVMDYQEWNMIDVKSMFQPRFDRVNVFYSNPDYYTQQKHTETAVARRDVPFSDLQNSTVNGWPVKTDDFFPYSDCPHCFWTGYFSSRSAFKRFERVCSSFLLVSRQLDSLAATATMVKEQHEVVRPLFPLEDAVGIAQHHDAVSGTAKQHVADDYSKKLSQGMNTASQHVAKILRREMLEKPTENSTVAHQALEDLGLCPLLNETICHISEKASAANDTVIYVIVYNPIAQNRSTIVNLPVSPDTTFQIERIEDASIDNGIGSQNATFAESTAVKPLRKDLPIKHVLSFRTGVLPPLGAVAFRISKELRHKKGTGMTDSQNPFPTPETERRLTSTSQIMSTGSIDAEFDSKSGLLTKLSTGNTSISVQQRWGYYTSYDASLDESTSSQNSGAYIFRPSIPQQELIPLTPGGSASFVNTSFGYEVHASFIEPWMKQVTRVVQGQSYIEVEYTVGPIPTCDGRGKEVVARLSTPIANKGVFYTDSNGREFQLRRRDARPSWDLQIFEPVAGNYYPVNSAMYLEDNKTASLAIVVDRSQGGASLTDGSLEIMVHRRTLADDSRGVDEPLNETCGGMTAYPPYGNSERIGDGVIVRGTHRILIGEGAVGASLARSQMDSAFAEPFVFVGSGPAAKPVSFAKGSFSGLNAPLPNNIMIVTFLRLLRGNTTSTFLVRLGHQYAPTENAKLSAPTRVDLSTLFRGYNVTSLSEKTLSGNQDMASYLKRRLEWSSAKVNPPVSDPADFVVTFLPLQVRTFEMEMTVVKSRLS